jgi:hypothetical protein
MSEQKSIGSEIPGKQADPFRRDEPVLPLGTPIPEKEKKNG